MANESSRSIVFEGSHGIYVEKVNDLTINSWDNYSENDTQIIEFVRSILLGLDSSYSPNDECRNKGIAKDAIDIVKKDRALSKRVLSAFKAGSVEAFEQALNHPAASFLIAAIQDWRKSE
jgi:hypothetical protein